jgi:Holliday junction resolvase RusA-like endonuclease
MNKVILKKNDDIDFFIGMIGDLEVPTKQDKFKPIDEFKIIIDGEEYFGENPFKGLYEKKDNKVSQKVYEEKFKAIIKSKLTREYPYKKEKKLEVIVNVLVKDKKRIESVDVDNLLKFVLDCFNGLVYEDDTQIVAVLGQKTLSQRDGLIVGIREVNDTKLSLFKDINVAHFEELSN